MSWEGGLVHLWQFKVCMCSCKDVLFSMVCFLSLWSRDDSSRKTLFIYLQVEITGQILSAKGLEIHLLLVCSLSAACLESWRSPFQNPQKWEQLQQVGKV